MKLIRSFFAASLLVLCWLAIGASPSTSTSVGLYIIGATLIHNGKIFASPSITTGLARSQTTTQAGDTAYSLRVKILSVSQDTLGVEFDLTSTYGNISSLASLHKNKAARFSAPGVELDLVANTTDHNAGFLAL